MKVGRTLSYEEGRLDDHKMLAELGFDASDHITFRSDYVFIYL